MLSRVQIHVSRHKVIHQCMIGNIAFKQCVQPSIANQMFFRNSWSTFRFHSTDSSKEKKGKNSSWLDRIKASRLYNSITTATVESSPPRSSLKTIIRSGCGAFTGMATLSMLHHGLTMQSNMTMIIGSMGASAALIFAAPTAPFSQPRNVIGGHCIAAFIGVTIQQSVLGQHLWLAIPTTVSLAIVTMLATKTLHPPAGGTSLIALAGAGGFQIMCPITLTATVLIGSGIVFNNMFNENKYPTYWW